MFRATETMKTSGHLYIPVQNKSGASCHQDHHKATSHGCYCAACLLIEILSEGRLVKASELARMDCAMKMLQMIKRRDADFKMFADRAFIKRIRRTR